MSIFSSEGFSTSGIFNYQMKLSTTNGIPGYEISECIGLIYAVGGGVSIGNKKTINKSYLAAVDALVNQANDAGANAIVGINFVSVEGFVHVSGTAVLIKK